MTAQTSDTGGIARVKLRRHRLLVAIAILIATLAVALSTSGMFLPFLLAMVIPSAVNLLLAAYILSFIPITTKAVKFPIFVGLSFLLATGVEVPRLLQRILYPPQVEQHIVRAVHSSRSIDFEEISDLAPRGLFVPANPFESRVALRLDIYSSPVVAWRFAESYGDRLRDDIDNTIGLGTSGPVNPAINPIFVTLTTQPNELNPRKADLSINVHSGEDVTATLIEKGVPAFRRIESRISGGSLVNRYFTANVAAILTHWTFWNPLVSRYFAYYPDDEVRRFLRQAILADRAYPRGHSAGS